MKKFLKIFFIALLLALPGFCQTVPTPNVGLQIPAAGSTNWNLPLNFNFNLLDQLLGGTLQSPGLGLQLRPIFGTGAPTAPCTASNQGQDYLDISTTPWTQYTCNVLAWGLSGGNSALLFPTGIVFGIDSTDARPATPADVSSLLAGLSGCSTANFLYSPANGSCIAGGSGGGGSPGAPSFALQFANNTVTGFQADSNFQVNPSTHTLLSGPGGLTTVNAFNSVPRAIYDPMNPNMNGGLAGAISGSTGQTPSQVIQATLDYAKCQSLMGLATPFSNIPLPSGSVISLSQIKLWSGQEVGGDDLMTMPQLQHNDATKPMIIGHVAGDTLTCSDGHVYTPGAASGVRVHAIAVSGMGPATAANDIAIESNGQSWLVEDIRGFGNGFGGQVIFNNGFENVFFRLGYTAAQLKGCQSYISGTLPVSSSPNGHFCAAVEDDSIDSEMHYVYATDGQQSSSGHAAGPCYPNCAAFSAGTNGDYNDLFLQVSDIDLLIAGGNNRFVNVRLDATSREMINITGGGNLLTNVQGFSPCTDSSLSANYSAGTPTGCAGIVDNGGGANSITNFSIGAAAGFFGPSYEQCAIQDGLTGFSGAPNTYTPANATGNTANLTQNDWLACGAFQGDQLSGRIVFPSMSARQVALGTANVSGVTEISLSTTTPLTNLIGGIPGQQLLVYQAFGPPSASIDVTGNILTCSGLPKVVSFTKATMLVNGGPPNNNGWAEVCPSPFNDYSHLNFAGNTAVSNPSVLDLYGNESVRQVPALSFNGTNIQIHGGTASSGQYCFELEADFSDNSHVISPSSCTNVDLTSLVSGGIFANTAPEATIVYLWLVSNTTTSSVPIGRYSGFTSVNVGSTAWLFNVVALGGNGATAPPANENTTGMIFDPWGVVINTYNNAQPNCTSGTRGRLWLLSGGGTAQDTLVQCQEGSSGTFGWATLGSGGGGSNLFSALLSGNNGSASMVVSGTASITATGGGLIAATTMPWFGLTGTVPIFNQNTSGNAATATQLAGTPTLCSGGQVPTGILRNGNATGCFTPGGTGGGSAFSAITNGTNTGTSMIVGNGTVLQWVGTGQIIASQTIGNSDTASGLASVPTLCSGGQVPVGILANGNATGCFNPAGSIAGTSGLYGLFSGTTTLGTGFLDYNITNPGMNTSTKPFVIQDGTGSSGFFSSTEGTALAGAAGKEILYGLTDHYFHVNMNNRGPQFMGAITTAGTPGDCIILDTDGIGYKDSGVAGCAGGGGTSFTPTFIADSGAGTTPTISFVSGANDNRGWINVTTGTAPAASAGVVTIRYGGTYTTVRKCEAFGSNPAAAALSGNQTIFVPQSSSATNLFVIQIGSTALAAGMAYQFFYSCGT